LIATRFVLTEEVFQSPEALWSSPDGSHLLFATFNDSAVRSLSYPWFNLAAPGGVGSVVAGAGLPFGGTSHAAPAGGLGPPPSPGGPAPPAAYPNAFSGSFPASRYVRYPTVRTALGLHRSLFWMP